jgi:hypothetical protein
MSPRHFAAGATLRRGPTRVLLAAVLAPLALVLTPPIS